jgi:GDP-L-fucose synthase
MDLADPIFVAGHRGMVGSALMRRLKVAGFCNLLVRSHSELDLIDPAAVHEFFDRHTPAYVLLAAARVGGIVANWEKPAEFLYQNLKIQTNVMHEAWLHSVKRLIFVGSSCIYPKFAEQPIREESLLSGPLEDTNRSYAIAKIAGVEMCRAYNQQYAARFLAIMPTNLYGPNDHYHAQYSHVIPALILKMHTAKVNGLPAVEIWGTGTPRREFLYSDDLADCLLYLLQLPDPAFDSLSVAAALPLLNVGCGRDIAIADLAELIAATVGYQGRLVFDPSKPDGTPRKLLDVSRLHAIGWRHQTKLHEGLANAYADFLSRDAIGSQVARVQ